MRPTKLSWTLLRHSPYPVRASAPIWLPEGRCFSICHLVNISGIGWGFYVSIALCDRLQFVQLLIAIQVTGVFWKKIIIKEITPNILIFLVFKNHYTFIIISYELTWWHRTELLEKCFWQKTFTSDEITIVLIYHLQYENTNFISSSVSISSFSFWSHQHFLFLCQNPKRWEKKVTYDGENLNPAILGKGQSRLFPQDDLICFKTSAEI